MNDTQFHPNPPQEVHRDGSGTNPQHLLSSGPTLAPGSLLENPSALDSQTFWGLLDFTTVLTIGALVTVPNFNHLRWLGTSTLWTAAGQVHLASAILFAACVTTLSRLLGLHNYLSTASASTETFLIGQNVSIAAFGVYGGLHLWDIAVPHRATLLSEILLTSLAMFAARLLWRRHKHIRFRKDIAVRNVIIAGVDPIGIEVRDYLRSLRCLGYRFKGFVTLGEDSEDPSAVDKNEIVGAAHNLIPLARTHFVDEIIFSQRPSTRGLLSDIIEGARANGIDIRLIPSLSETLKNREDVRYLGNLPTIAIHQKDLNSVSRIVKRAIDILVASLGLLIALPVLAATAIAIKIGSPGPVFYLSKRVGYKGNLFTCYKFRTMSHDAESKLSTLAHLNERDGILFKIVKDPRITHVGAFLRKYSLDELPQLWNVVKGDMSLVGPRPSIGSEVARYQLAHLGRLDVVPGITGLWQVEARTDPSFDNYIALDRKYISEWSIWLDLTILVRTVLVVVRGTGS